MEKPDQRLFEHDLQSAEFRIGAEKGRWGLPGSGVSPENLAWPIVILWIAAAPRPGAPERFYVMLDAAGYRTVPPTGMFWDSEGKTVLVPARRPKGKPNSRVAMVFRVDWNNATAFYHPYDRVAAQGHTDWTTTQPHLVWTSNHTIVDFLEEFHSLLNSGDYLGV
jgi:hypothetical protein